MSGPKPGFVCEPLADNPEWFRWRLSDPDRFNEAVLGPFLIRAEGPDSARVRIVPQLRHTNLGGNVHGGVILGLIDCALFAALKLLRNVDAGNSVTLGLDTQFIGAGDPALPLDALVDVLRETKRLSFLRGLVVQDEANGSQKLAAAFSATVRKASASSLPAQA